ncbi:MAG: hypothetical protein IJ410_00225 [Oscillospiraceae bacterium]|nr:hypothetical protein [Oscillospiraceae bacterium]
MKFTVTANEEGFSVDELMLEAEEKENIGLAVNNMAYGTTAALLEFVQNFASDTTNAQEIFNLMLQHIRAVSDEFFSNEAGRRQDEVIYEISEEVFLPWVYGQGYSDVYEFIDRYGDRELKMAFTVNGDTVEVFFVDADGNRQDDIGEIEAINFTIAPDFAARQCLELTAIAWTALDRLYGQRNNYLRKNPVNDLEKAIRAELKI